MFKITVFENIKKAKVERQYRYFKSKVIEGHKTKLVIRKQ
jgi:hypothetical protein